MKMSNIDNLIKQYCPNGVEYKRIEGVCDSIIAPKKLNKKNYLKEGAYPIIDQGQQFIVAYTNDISAIVPQDNYVIFGDHTRSVKFANFPFAQGADGLKILKSYEQILPKYLYYSMLNLDIPNRGYNRHWTIVKEMTIPIPPLPVQEEIVKVLDAFTALEAELEAELEARKRQYEYYRNKLLTFDENTTGGGIDWKILSEVFDIKNGYTPSKANKEFWKNGTIPWFRMEDIRENGRILNDSIQHITPQAVKGGKLFPANSIIVATTATIGEHALITVDSLANQRFTCLSKKVNRYNELDMKFFYYYMFVIDEWCKNNTNVSGFASVDMNKFKKLMIPIPPIEEQERIVAILDKFDSLVNDISEGLPAELTARRQQYEYYRNKLLTFDEAA